MPDIRKNEALRRVRTIPKEYGYLAAAFTAGATVLFALAAALPASAYSSWGSLTRTDYSGGYLTEYEMTEESWPDAGEKKLASVTAVLSSSEECSGNFKAVVTVGGFQNPSALKWLTLTTEPQEVTFYFEPPYDTIEIADITVVYPAMPDPNTSGHGCYEKARYHYAKANTFTGGRANLNAGWDAAFLVSDKGELWCGDGSIDGTEECDDGDEDDEDGCSSACEVEWGYMCVGEPSMCAWSNPFLPPTTVKITWAEPNFGTDPKVSDLNSTETPYEFRAVTDINKVREIGEYSGFKAVIYDTETYESCSTIQTSYPYSPFTQGDKWWEAEFTTADALCPAFVADRQYLVEWWTTVDGNEGWDDRHIWRYSFVARDDDWTPYEDPAFPECRVFGTPSFISGWTFEEGDGMACLWTWAKWLLEPDERTTIAIQALVMRIAEMKPLSYVLLPFAAFANGLENPEECDIPQIKTPSGAITMDLCKEFEDVETVMAAERNQNAIAAIGATVVLGEFMIFLGLLFL